MFVLALAFSLGAHLALLPGYDAVTHNLSNGERLLSTPDGYYYLRQAEDFKAGAYTPSDPLRPGKRLSPVPPLSVLAAIVSTVSGQPIERVAFFLPPVLGSLAVLVGLLAGVAAGSAPLGFMAALLTMTAEAWFSRTALGGFDTDCLLPLLFYGMLYALFRFERGPWRWGAAALALAGGLHWWWPQAGRFFAVAALGPFLVSAFLPGEGRLRTDRRVCVVLGAVLAGLWLAGLGAYLPDWLRWPMGVLDKHLRFALSGQKSVFTQTGWSVEELTGMGPLEALEFLSGHWALGCLALAGTIGFCCWRPRLGLYYGLPALGMLGASMIFGNRFALFAMPVHALGLAWLCAVALPYALGRFGRIAAVASWTACLTLAGLSLWTVYEGHGLVATFDANQVAMARAIDKVAGKDAAVWNWWGPGYMVQYYGKRETFFDGGLQTPERAFISAEPLASLDPLAARNWIKFFSVHPNGLNVLARPLGKERAVGFLRAVFENPGSLDVLVEEYSLGTRRDWRAWLFPSREVYLVLYSEMMLRNSWLKIGLWDEKTGKSPETPVYALPLSTLSFDRKRGLMYTAKDKVTPYSRLLFVSPDQLSHDRPREHGHVVVLLKGVDMAYIVPERFFDVLAFRLLFMYPEDTPGFQAVTFNPFVGGVWRVL